MWDSLKLTRSRRSFCWIVGYTVDSAIRTEHHALVASCKAFVGRLGLR